MARTMRARSPWRERQRGGQSQCSTVQSVRSEKRKRAGPEVPRLRSAVQTISSQKSNCAPILKNRACSTLVGRSQLLVAAVENVLVTVNGQSLLKTL